LLAFLAGWCAASVVAACFHPGDPAMGDDFVLRVAGGCAFLPVVTVGLVMGAVGGLFWSPGWQLAPGWGAPIGIGQFLLLRAVGPRMPMPERRWGRRMWRLCFLAYLLVVPCVTGLLAVSVPR
jgi:hypothetical protein